MGEIAKSEIVKSENFGKAGFKTKMKEKTENKQIGDRNILKNQTSPSGVGLIPVENQEIKENDKNGKIELFLTQGEKMKTTKLKPTKIKFDNENKNIGFVKSSWYDKRMDGSHNDIVDIEKVKTSRYVLRK